MYDSSFQTNISEPLELPLNKQFDVEEKSFFSLSLCRWFTTFTTCQSRCYLSVVFPLINVIDNISDIPLVFVFYLVTRSQSGDENNLINLYSVSGQVNAYFYIGIEYKRCFIYKETFQRPNQRRFKMF